MDYSMKEMAELSPQAARVRVSTRARTKLRTLFIRLSFPQPISQAVR